MAGCSPEGTAAHTVDEFIASYDADHFIFDKVIATGGIFGDVSYDGKEVKLSMDNAGTYKDKLTAFFTKDNTRFNVTEIVSAEGSRTCTRNETYTDFTIEAKDVKIVFKYKKQTSSDNGKTWNNVEGTTEETGYLYFSGKKHREKVSDRGGDPDTNIYTYSDVKLSVTNLSGDGYCDVSKSDLKSYSDISWKVKEDSSYIISWAKCVNTDMSEADITKIHDYIKNH